MSCYNMFKDIVVRRYLVRPGGKMGVYVIMVGERDKVDKYIVEKFGLSNISTSEDLDGYPIIHPDLTTEENESNMLNKILYL